MDISGDGFELRQEFFVIKGDLGIIGFTLTQRIGIGALIGYYAVTGFGDYFGAGQFTGGAIEPSILLKFETQHAPYLTRLFNSYLPNFTGSKSLGNSGDRPAFTGVFMAIL